MDGDLDVPCGLPKRPLMVVLGKALPVGDALEIIRRTDYVFQTPYVLGGVDHPGQCHDGVKPGMFSHPCLPQDPDPWPSDMDGWWAPWRDKWKPVLAYGVCNHLVHYGVMEVPEGWIRPDGHVGGACHLTEKHMSHGEILEDLAMVALAFPALDMDVMVCDRATHDEGRPLPMLCVTVHGGSATVTDPSACFGRFGSSVDAQVDHGLATVASREERFSRVACRGWDAVVSEFRDQAIVDAIRNWQQVFGYPSTKRPGSR